MNKILITLIAVLTLGFANAGNFSATLTWLGGDAFAPGAQFSVALADSADLTVDAITNGEEIDVFIGLREYIADFDNGDRMYASVRFGASNPVNDFLSAPDDYTLAAGLGGINGGNLIEGNLFVQTDTAFNLNWGFGVSAGIGIGW